MTIFPWYFDTMFAIFLIFFVVFLLYRKRSLTSWKRTDGVLTDTVQTTRGEEWKYSYTHQGKTYAGRELLLGSIFDSPIAKIGERISLLVDPVHPKKSRVLYANELRAIDDPYLKLAFLLTSLWILAHIVGLLGTVL